MIIMYINGHLSELQYHGNISFYKVVLRFGKI